MGRGGKKVRTPGHSDRSTAALPAVSTGGTFPKGVFHAVLLTPWGIRTLTETCAAAGSYASALKERDTAMKVDDINVKEEREEGKVGEGQTRVDKEVVAKILPLVW